MQYVSAMHRLPLRPLIEAVQTEPATLIAAAEARYQSEIEAVCRTATEQWQRVILLCGPSSAGKTTSAKKLIAVLKAGGHKVNRVSLDDFYKNREDLPLWPDGTVNFESIEGLDLALFHRQMRALFQTGAAEFPVYNFKRPENRDTFRLAYDEDTYTIVEGIHALNPRIAESLNGASCCRVYVSVHSDFVTEGGAKLTGRTLRLARRMIRDVSHRNTAPDATFGMWDAILRGELLYIHRFRESADFHIDTTHAYEPFVYAGRLRKLLAGRDGEAGLAGLLLASFAGLPQMDEGCVPKTSLLQEFIG